MKSLIHLTTLMLFVIFAGCAKKETILHVIQAPYGQVIGSQESGYKLKLEEIDDTVIWFSDRPERKAGNIHIEDLLKSWNEGQNSYKKDPPNAVFVIGDSGPVVVELILTSWDESSATFEMKPIKGEITDTRGYVTLYVDGGFDIVNPQITD